MEKKTLAETKTQFEKFKVNYEYQLIMSNISFLNCFFWILMLNGNSLYAVH